MQIYCVGGAVRDELLGRRVQDRDWVVVGATPEQMTALGYRPVGKDFPVFLHPETYEEYALARTERKTAKGYKGFQIHAAPDVTLEQDLERRDLTINAIARDAAGNLIDPHHGAADLQAKILRHVGAAFIEDPVRILRLARFAARFSDFTVAGETMALMRKMVANGEVDALVPERVWQELAKGLMESQPSRMFAVLRECGALKKIMPEIDRLFGVPQPPQHHPEIDTGVHVMLVVDYSAAHGFTLPVRFAALTHDLGKGTTPKEMLPRHIGHEERGPALIRELCRRLRVPNDCRDLALATARYHGKAGHALEMRPATVVQLLHDTNALRQPQRFTEFLQACESDTRGRPGYETHALPELEYLERALAAAQTVDAGAIAKNFDDAEKIKEAVFSARVEAVRRLAKP
ncbi:MAG: multifunctional CCA addition/repair protein [Methylobacillus sp.]|jgi:tRNA nucleotidyltransferase (CCA-adding enzyme)|nr:multifunctional CCA addition/repair protein [Methylobacillus sp.]